MSGSIRAAAWLAAMGMLASCALIDALGGGLGGNGDLPPCESEDDCGMYASCTTEGCQAFIDLGHGAGCIGDSQCQWDGQDTPSSEVSCWPGAAECTCEESVCVADLGQDCDASSDCPAGSYCELAGLTCHRLFACGSHADCPGMCSTNGCVPYRSDEQHCDPDCATGTCIGLYCYANTSAPCSDDEDCDPPDSYCHAFTSTCWDVVLE